MREKISADLPDTFQKDRKIVCVQGLGFVGAAMSLAIANARDEKGEPLYHVIGLDLPDAEGSRKIESMNHGKFPFQNTDKNLEKAQKEAFSRGNFYASSDASLLAYADMIVVDINLDLKYTKDHKPLLDLRLFREAIHTIGQYMKEEALVIVETTVPPGTCSNIVYPVLCEEFARRNRKTENISVAHSYERVMPGEDYFDSIVNFWRVYAGINERSADRCCAFLESVIRTDQYPLTRLENTTASEMAKVLENSYRAANIAFIDEWGRFAEEVHVDLYKVIEAIRMRPTHSNMRQPGFGVGGYCLTKDPYFAPLAASEIFGLRNLKFPCSTGAVEINNRMPVVSLDKIEKCMGGDLAGKRLLILGVSYRQDVGDTRYSPAEIFAKEALARGAVLTYEDPLVSVWPEMHVDVLQEIPPFTDYDGIVFTVMHKTYQEIDFKTRKISPGTLIFDANCVLTETQRKDIGQLEQVVFQSIGR